MARDTSPPPDEARRLATLEALALIEAGPEREFDSLVALAAEMLDCTAAMLNLVDRDEVRVKASTVAGPATFPRTSAFCDHALRADGLLVIDDLALDDRFAENPVVTDMGIRFYAGVPLRAPDADGVRHSIGTLCVLGKAPRPLAERGRRALLHLAGLAEALIAVRATARHAIDVARTSAAQAIELARKDRIFRQAERMAMMGSWRLSLEDERLEWSDNVFRIHGVPTGAPPSIAAALDHYPPEARGRVAAAIAHTLETGEPFDFEEEFVTAAAKRRRVRALGEMEVLDGRPVGIVGVFRDVTAQHALETALRRSADTDALTGLVNRAAFERALERAMAAARASGAPLLLALVDLDGFKAVNDTLGHLAGDDVLREVGRALRAPWLGDACAARLGGDEFAVIVQDPRLATDPAAFSRALDEALHVPAVSGGLTMMVAGTVGHYTFRPDVATVREFVHRADLALYDAKRARVGERRHADRRRPERRTG